MLLFNLRMNLILYPDLAIELPLYINVLFDYYIFNNIIHNNIIIN